jgi:isoquinoline 1-oxidoreductase subunit alpha
MSTFPDAGMRSARAGDFCHVGEPGIVSDWDFPEARGGSDTPLLWALRDELGLNGTKFGCGMALCGACTVHVDGHRCAPVYCQTGQIMSATALLRRNPRPSDADIDDAMSGNICRCGTYIRIRSAIKRTASRQGGVA